MMWSPHVGTQNELRVKLVEMDKHARPAGLRGHFETGMAPSSHRRIEASITRQMEELEAQEHSSDAESAVGNEQIPSQREVS